MKTKATIKRGSPFKNIYIFDTMHIGQSFHDGEYNAKSRQKLSNSVQYFYKTNGKKKLFQVGNWNGLLTCVRIK